jgi:iron complex outermembrane receptor protein
VLAGLLQVAQITKKINYTLFFGNFNRNPTWADLYWKPFGNPNLKNETGLSFEQELSVKHTFKNIHTSLKLSHYIRQTNNWISWFGGTYFTPKNIGNVQSKGLETKLTLQNTPSPNKIIYTFDLYTNYNTSSFKNNNVNNVNGYQLAYMPLYQGTFFTQFKYKKVALLYAIAYTGYRFTTNDESNYLPAYTQHNAMLMFEQNVHHSLSVSINNILNASYQTIKGYAMPGRLLGLNYTFKL